MKIEKRIISLCLCALAVGIAITLPLTYFTPAKAQTIDEHWFTIGVPYAYINANLTDNGRIFKNEIKIVFPQTINYDAITQRGNARIEYFEFLIYTGDGRQLAKELYFLGTNTSVDFPLDLVTSLARDFSDAESNWMYNDSVGLGTGCIPNLSNPPPAGEISRSKNYTLTDGYNSYSPYLKERNSVILDVMENEQVIYLDVIRRGYTEFDGSETVVTLANRQVMYHLEMTKSDKGGFTFGNLSMISLLEHTHSTASGD